MYSKHGKKKNLQLKHITHVRLIQNCYPCPRPAVSVEMDKVSNFILAM